MKSLIIVLLAIVLLLIILTLLSHYILYVATGFNKRCDGNENLKYLKAKNFDNLNALPIEFKQSKGIILRGFIYTSAKIQTYKGLIVFSHGMGGGHLSYTTEINYFAQKGYAVLAYDNTGTCASDGKSLGGIAQGVLDLKSAIEFSKTRDDLKDLPLLLVGHSWGAYSVCNLLHIYPDANVKGILAFSPFASVNTLIKDMAKSKTKLNLSFLAPFFDIANIIKYGKTGLLNSAETVASNQVPTLIMHGGNDMVVRVKNSPLNFKSKLSLNVNARTILYESKYHNVYLAKDAESYLNDTFNKIGILGENTPEAYEVYKNIDYSLITKEDLTVMETATNFLEECVMKREFLNE